MKVYSPDEFERVLFDEETIRQRVHQLGRQITEDYLTLGRRHDEAILAVGLMRGAMPFMADLGRAINLALEYELLWLSSYEDSDRPGRIQLIKDLRTPVTDRHVLLLEDITDTGHTLAFALELFAKRRPASVRTCCLIDKRARREIEVPLEYVGFVMHEDEFVVGYGLDYAGRYRNLPYVATLNPKIYKG